MTFRHPPHRRKSLGERFDDFCFFYAPGEECGRWHEADEDADGEDTAVICDTCGELA